MPKTNWGKTRAQKDREAQEKRQGNFREAVASGLARRDMSQMEMAEAVGCSQGSVSTWKKDVRKMSVGTFGAVARELGWGPDTVYKIICG